jgi:hypothetical protein
MNASATATKGVRSLAKGITSCSGQAATYGQCITASYQDVHKDMCQKEFQAFKQCVEKAVSLLFMCVCVYIESIYCIILLLHI